MSWCVALSMRRNGCQINRGVNAVSQSHCKITGNRKLIHYRSFKWLNFNISAVCVTHTLGNISHCFVKKWTYFQLSCTHQVKISVNICLLFFLILGMSLHFWLMLIIQFSHQRTCHVRWVKPITSRKFLGVIWIIGSYTSHYSCIQFTDFPAETTNA